MKLLQGRDEVSHARPAADRQSLAATKPANPDATIQVASGHFESRRSQRQNTCPQVWRRSTQRPSVTSGIFQKAHSSNDYLTLLCPIKSRRMLDRIESVLEPLQKRGYTGLVCFFVGRAEADAF